MKSNTPPHDDGATFGDGWVRSDAWLLLSLIYGGGPLDLERICRIGDYINHTIFSDDELQGGLRRLIDHGHALQVGDDYAAAPEVMKWYASVVKGKKSTYVFKDLERVEKFLGIHRRA